MKYGKQFETATADEVRRLLAVADDEFTLAIGWLIEWATTENENRSMIHDPRTDTIVQTTPDAVAAHFEQTNAYHREAHYREARAKAGS